jgi:tRNA(adenine34) deaminase
MYGVVMEEFYPGLQEAWLRTDEDFIREAVKEAEKAVEYGKVPVGAIIVYEGRIVARAFNRRETSDDPTAHAEVYLQ